MGIQPQQIRNYPLTDEGWARLRYCPVCRCFTDHDHYVRYGAPFVVCTVCETKAYDR